MVRVVIDMGAVMRECSRWCNGVVICGVSGKNNVKFEKCSMRSFLRLVRLVRNI